MHTYVYIIIFFPNSISFGGDFKKEHFKPTPSKDSDFPETIKLPSAIGLTAKAQSNELPPKVFVHNVSPSELIFKKINISSSDT